MVRLGRIGPGWAAIIGLVATVAMSGCEEAERYADTVFTGGPVWTADPDNPAATGVAVRNGRIVEVGSGRLSHLVGPGTRVVDLEGRALLPGFIDSHVHFTAGGFQLSSVDLRDAATPEEFARRIGEFAEGIEPGSWITGGDWDHELWGGELPQSAWIDAISPDNPVFVSRLDGHMALANSLAIRLAGVTADTPDPAGGAIVRSPDGAPTGVFKDEAMALVFGAVPPPSASELEAAALAAARHALERGVTQVHDMGSWDDLAAYRRLHERGELPLRVYAVVPMSTWRRLADLVGAEGRGDDRLWWGGLKAFVDGSLGSTTAWFYEPYLDDPATSGLMTTDTTELRQWILDSDAAGLHTVVHAIGDRANDWLLDVYASLPAINGDRDRRPRIEHAQHLSTDGIGRFAPLGVIASMQPFHAADDGRWAEKRIGAERIRTTYAFRSLLDAGATIAFGSDWTVAPMNPMLGLDAAVTRRTIDGANPYGWVPEERITVEESLRAYTASAAYAGFAEAQTGRIVIGKRADLVVLSGDPMGISDTEIAGLRVELTMVDGDVVFEREER